MQNASNHYTKNHGFLFILITLCCLNSVESLDTIVYKPLSNETITSAASNNFNDGGISAWSGLGSAIRVSFFSDAALPNIQEFNSTSQLIQELISFFMPVIIFLGIFWFFGIVMLLYLLVIRKCCRKCVKRNPNGYSRPSKLCAMVLFLVSISAISVCLITGLQGSHVKRYGLELFVGSLVNTVDDSLDQVGEAKTILISGIQTIETGIDETVDQVVASLGDSLLSGFEITPTANAIRDIATQLEVLLQSAIVASQIVNEIKDLITQLDTGAANINTIVDSLNSPSTDGGVTYTLNAPIAAIDLTGVVGAPLRNLLDTFDISSQIPNINLNSLADQIEADYSAQAINDMLSSYTLDFSKTLNNQISSMKVSIEEQVSSTETMIDDQVDAFSPMVQAGLSGLIFYGSFQYVFYYGLFMIILFQMVVMVLFASSNKPKIMKGCTMSFFVVMFWMFLFIVGTVELLLATTFGEVCNVGFGSGSSARLAESYPDVSDMIGITQSTQKACSDGKNVISALETSGVFQKLNVDPNMLNITYQIDKIWTDMKIDETIQGLANQIPSFSTPDISQSIRDLENNQNIQNIIQDVLNQPQLSGSLLTQQQQDDFNTLLTTLETSMKEFNPLVMYTFDPVQAPGSAVLGVASQSYVTRTNNLVLELRNIVGSTEFNSIIVGQMNDYTTRLVAEVTKIQTAFTGVTNAGTNAANTILNEFAKVNESLSNLPTTIQAQVPVVKNSLYTIGDDIWAIVSGIECQVLASDLYAVQNSLCTATLSGFDAVWLSCVVLALTFLGSIPVFIIMANRVVYHPDDADENNKKKKKRKGLFGRKKGKSDSDDEESPRRSFS